MNRCLAWLTFGMAFIGCSDNTPVNSEVRHDFGRFNNGLGKEWYTDKIPDYVASDGPMLPSDHPATLRLQKWMNEIHKQAMIVDSSLIKIPAPKIVIVKSDELNAYAPTAPSGIMGQFYIDFDPLTPPDDNWGRAYWLGGQYFYPSSVPDVQIVNWQEFENIVNMVFQNFPGCFQFIRTETVPSVSLASSCFAVLPKEKKFTILPIKLQSSHMVFKSPILGLPEAQLVSVIAHELAHYYMAFSNTNHLYSQIYPLDKMNPLGKPSGLPLDHPLAKAAGDAINFGEKLYYYPVEGQKFHSAIFSWTEANIWRTDSNPLCEPARSILKDSLDYIVRPGFPESGPLPEAVRNTYLSFEDALIKCLQSTPIWTQSELIDSLYSFDYSAEARQLALKDYSTVMEFITDLNALIPEAVELQGKRYDDLVNYADSLRVGYYTAEQEADEISLELSRRVGLIDDVGVDLHLSLLKYSEKQGKKRGGMTYDECLQERDLGWPSIVPIGFYYDSHHSGCFRAFNAARESMTHKAKLDSITPSLEVQLDPSGWRGIQELLEIEPLDSDHQRH